MKNLLWLDLETTGLSPTKDSILMVAAARTDEAGNVTESMEWVIRVPFQHLAVQEWDPVVVRMHTENGLLDRLRSGEVKDHQDIEKELVAFIGPDKPILAGNSIHFDRRFLEHHMPWAAGRLHYRMLDVSSLKIAAGVWGLPEYPKMKKHLALDDVKASIAEFMHWRRAFGFGVGGEFGAYA